MLNNTSDLSLLRNFQTTLSAFFASKWGIFRQRKVKRNLSLKLFFNITSKEHSVLSLEGDGKEVSMAYTKGHRKSKLKH